MALADMPEAQAPRGTLLAFDFGLARIGVAVGQTQTGTANPLETVSNTGDGAWRRIQQLVSEWRPVAMVVGLPLDSEGLDTDMSRNARRFADTLSDKTGLHVYLQDERLTSRAAEEAFVAMRAAGARRRRDAVLKDAFAAKIILENWLQSRPRQMG
jgi:putative Holliday junction resolvase